MFCLKHKNKHNRKHGTVFNLLTWKYSGTSVYILNLFQILGLKPNRTYTERIFPIRYCDALTFLDNGTVDKTPATIGAGNPYTTQLSTKPWQRNGSKHLHRNETFGEGVFYSVLHVHTSGETHRVRQLVRVNPRRENLKRVSPRRILRECYNWLCATPIL
jgi:hypothetical protein